MKYIIHPNGLVTQIPPSSDEQYWIDQGCKIVEADSAEEAEKQKEQE